MLHASAVRPVSFWHAVPVRMRLIRIVHESRPRSLACSYAHQGSLHQVVYALHQVVFPLCPVQAAARKLQFFAAAIAPMNSARISHASCPRVLAGSCSHQLSLHQVVESLQGSARRISAYNFLVFQHP